WAPPARKYAVEIAAIAESFMDGPCKAADPHPELVAEARAGTVAHPQNDQGAVKAAEAPTERPASATAPARVAETADNGAEAGEKV
ncbi:hypothetical protein ABTK20_21535, partial [Acinetobacter baumannii]